MTSEQKIRISTEADGQKTLGFVMRRELSRHERMLRAGKMLGILWLIGMFTIFIPILHFILPPLFILAGILFATTTWFESAEILGGEIACPNCKAVMVFQREAEEWPKSQRCAGCSYMLTLNPDPVL